MMAVVIVSYFYISFHFDQSSCPPHNIYLGLIKWGCGVAVFILFNLFNFTGEKLSTNYTLEDDQV